MTFLLIGPFCLLAALVHPTGLTRGGRGLRLLATPVTAESARGSAELRADLLAALEAEILPGRYIPTSGSEGSKKIVGLIEQLERSKAPPRFPADLAMVDGSWDLLFTTNAVSIDQNLLNSLGALPATPLSPLLDGSPLRTRRVRQEIDVAANRVRNCVTITAWPEGGGELFPPVLKELLAGLEGSDLCLTLDHLAVVENALSPASAQYMPARLRIELQQVRRILEPGPIPASSVGAGLLDLVPKETSINIPWPFSTFSPGRFDTTYVDESLRISRGIAPGKELRVFRRSATPTTVVSEGGI